MGWLADLEETAHDLGYEVMEAKPGAVKLYWPEAAAGIEVSSVLLGGPLLRQVLRPTDRAVERRLSRKARE